MNKTPRQAAAPALRPPRQTQPSTASPQGAEPSTDTVLLAVVGLSPAVLTETIWALAHEPEPVVPTRVIAVTTTVGRERIIAQLLRPNTRLSGQTPWDALRATLQAQGTPVEGHLRFGETPDDLRVITGQHPDTSLGVELPDIRTAHDSQVAADYLLDQVRSIVENPDSTLVASIAGGRKTMGALLYACMTLAGRETDRLTHVLVSEPYETLPDFFFPGQPGGAVPNRSGTQSHDPANAQVSLADVTFVPLRNLFIRELNTKAGSFARLVNTCESRIDEVISENVRLEIESARTEFKVNNTVIFLTPRQHALLLFLATRAKNHQTPFTSYKDATADLDAFCDGLRSRASKEDWNDWRTSESINIEWTEEAIRKAVNEIRARLKKAGGEAPPLAHLLPKHGRCSLNVPGPLIYIKP